MVFPLFKLGTLFIKTATKPLSNAVRQHAKNHPNFAKLCHHLATSYHYTYTGLAKPLRLPYRIAPPTEAQAVELGANLVGEGVIFGIASGVLYYEYHKSSTKSEELAKTLRDLEENISDLQRDQNRLHHILFTHVLTKEKLMKIVEEEEAKNRAPIGHCNFMANFLD